MKLLIAAESLGEEGDFAWTIRGELVHLPPAVCCSELCGCSRAMAGFVSHKATTCFTVADLDIDATTYTELLWGTLEAGGWVAEDSVEDRAWVEEWADEHIRLAAKLEPGRVFRVRHDRTVPGP